MGKRPFSDRLYEALPSFYIGAGLLVMLALRNVTAVLVGLVLMAVGSVELMRNQRLRSALQKAEARIAASITPSRAGDPGRGLVQISWDSAYACGHPVIDGQHQRLFENGDELINAVLKQEPGDRIEVLLDALVEDIRHHFSTEEAVLARTKYPLSTKHQELHRKLLEKAESLRDHYRSEPQMVNELVGFIACDVISGHIVNDDLKFALKPR